MMLCAKRSRAASSRSTFCTRALCRTPISVVVELRPRGGRRGAARLRRAPGTHWEHRRRSAPVLHEAVVVPSSVVVPTAAVMATGMGTEDEAGEEDRTNNEDDTGHDADPGSHRSEPAVAA